MICSYLFRSSCTLSSVAIFSLSSARFSSNTRSFVWSSLISASFCTALTLRWATGAEGEAEVLLEDGGLAPGRGFPTLRDWRAAAVLAVEASPGLAKPVRAPLIDGLGACLAAAAALAVADFAAPADVVEVRLGGAVVPLLMLGRGREIEPAAGLLVGDCSIKLAELHIWRRDQVLLRFLYQPQGFSCRCWTAYSPSSASESKTLLPCSMAFLCLDRLTQ